MKNNLTKFSWFFALLTAFGVAGDLSAAQMPNPRAASSVATSGARGVAEKTVTRGNGGAVVSRSATASGGARVAARAATGNAHHVVRSAANVTNRSAVNPANVSRAATLVRSAAVRGMPARNASLVSDLGIMRAATRSRATAVFSDISKIGGGYAKCREAYATCMDQFCANANDTYRRCYCSSRFTDFRDTEDALDQAMTLLAQFEDNNLNAVDKTAAEVNAMYSATVGEEAIKRDTSGAQKVLNEIGDLLSGKKKANSNQSNGLIELDFSSSLDDIWGSSGSSIFDNDRGVNMSELEGVSLYNAANKQCLEVISDSCENAATLNMSTSAYNIMITQDCNAYEKVIETQKNKVEDTVRQAEKYLREARLEEYRAHNSADVNECIDKVRTAILADTACGTNYHRCLDYSGLFISQTTGDVIYGPQLFKLAEQITLDGTSDILGANGGFNQFLDTKRAYANKALDSCRDNAELVWNEFKRAAIIEIAQAQDAKIEQVKMSCVSTMTECYDTQSDALKSFDDTTAQLSGALSAAAARDMCKDKVIACAALYGNSDKCTFDKAGRFTGDLQSCGLASLMNFVALVDDTRISEGCEAALQSYANDMCTPKSGDYGYPWNCRLMNVGGDYSDSTKTQRTAVDSANAKDNDMTSRSNKTLAGILKYRAETVCRDVDADDTNGDFVTDIIDDIVGDVSEGLYGMLVEECESVKGSWLNVSGLEGISITNSQAFSSDVLIGDGLNSSGLGYCINDERMAACANYNAGDQNIATYDIGTKTCTFVDSWLIEKCEMLGGAWEDNVCYVKKR